jgi:hypothetical protein
MGRIVQMIRTLARKFDVVHRNTVASSNAIPTACRMRLCGFCFSPSSHSLTTLAGDSIGESMDAEYRVYSDSSLTRYSSLTRGGIVANTGVGGAMVFPVERCPA